MDKGLGCSEVYAFGFYPKLRSYTTCYVVQESLHPCALAPIYLLSLALPPIFSSYLEGSESHCIEEAM